jgi:GT2 family glycosyltransferase
LANCFSEKQFRHANTAEGQLSSAARLPNATVVVATRNRSRSLLLSLEKLVALPERPQVIVVDNASTDDTRASVTDSFPEITVIGLGHNAGGAARTAGVERASTPHVAFSDDDSWWAPGAIARAGELFETYPRLGLIAGRILVGPKQRLDDTCAVMASSPLGTDADLPGPSVLGFIACGAVVRRDAYLEVGGFRSRLSVGGEEEILAVDLAERGWGLAYVPEVVAHHHPSDQRDEHWRRRVVTRNALWSVWLRRRAGGAAQQTWRLMRGSVNDPAGRAGIADALRGLPWVLRERRPVSARLEAQLCALDP